MAKKSKKITRVKLNRKTYNVPKEEIIIEKPSKKISKILITILLVSITINTYTLYHFITFNHHKEKIVTETVEKYKVPENIVFLGDSITDFYDLKKYYKDYHVVNSGINGNIINDILDNMEERVYRYNPSKVFILIGTNDIQKDKSKEEIVDKIKELVEKIKKNRKETEIYLESIYPVNNTDDDKIDHDMVGKRKNKTIKEINKEIEEYCKKNNVTYINLYDLLKDDKDNLKLEYTKEGLHISDKGYEVITKKIKEYL